MEDPDTLPSVFEAMGIGAGESLFEGGPDRFPRDFERELERDFGWPSERQWTVLRRIVFRDVQAV
jgi:hypothetical protein